MSKALESAIAVIERMKSDGALDRAAWRVFVCDRRLAAHVDHVAAAEVEDLITELNAQRFKGH